MLPAEEVRNKLKLKAFAERQRLFEKHPHIQKILSDKKIDLGKIRQYSTKILGTGALAALLLLSAPALNLLPAMNPAGHENVNVDVESAQQILLTSLQKILPGKVMPLTTDQEKKIEIVFKDILGVSAKATLEGEHLNTTYGLIGAEQLLRRYPGDSVSSHNVSTNEGMAPGLGAWGYFAPNEAKLTSDLVEDEKWYVAVQTLYLSDWTKRLSYLRDWYKYRKVLVVNTLNGNAVVADIADSGPAAWTGKNFGGSPAVMQSLGGAKYKVGSVVLFFVDDPNNTVPLGPVSY